MYLSVITKEKEFEGAFGVIQRPRIWCLRSLTQQDLGLCITPKAPSSLKSHKFNFTRNVNAPGVPRCVWATFEMKL